MIYLGDLIKEAKDNRNIHHIRTLSQTGYLGNYFKIKDLVFGLHSLAYIGQTT